MEFNELLKKRRSIRSFYTNLDIPIEKIIEIIRAGMFSPSAGDLQPWSFIVIKNRERIEKLAEITEEDWLSSANSIVAVVVNKSNYESFFYDKACQLLHQTVGACVMTMLYKATELNIGSCWVAGFEEEAVNELLGIPSNKTCAALVALGIPAEKPHKKTIKSIYTSLFFEEYGEKNTEEIGVIPDIIEKVASEFVPEE